MSYSWTTIVFFFFSFTIISKAADDVNKSAAPKCDETLHYYTLSTGFNLPYYTYTDAVTTPNTAIRTLLTVVHGTGRNAKDYYCYMASGVARWLTPETAAEIFIWAPKFPIPGDFTSSKVVFWAKNNGWKQGDLSDRSQTRISSFSVLDEIFGQLIAKNIYPNLKTIILTGHSAGGQYAQRYALASPFVDSAAQENIAMRFFPANPSSYVYMSSLRARIKTPVTCAYCVLSEIKKNLTVIWEKPQNADLCPSYDNWKYGLNGTGNNYLRKTPNSKLISQYIKRDVTYVAGQADVCNHLLIDPPTCDCVDSNLDVTCGAMIQGSCRLARAYNYFNHVMQISSGNCKHKLVQVPGISHNGTGIYNSKEVLAAMFPNGKN